MGSVGDDFTFCPPSVLNLLYHRRQDSSSPTLPSNSIQSQLEEADSDVLLLLDCCHAAHPTLTDSDHGVTEAIAACGFETTAPGVGPHSFTNALIRELEIASQGPPISVAKLHGKILWRLKTWKPSLQRDRDGNLWQDQDGKIPTEREQRVTAVHCFLTNETIYRSILLAPLKGAPNSSSTASSLPIISPPSSPTSASGSQTASHSGGTSGSSSGKTTSSQISEPDKAQVLISISIDSDQIENNRAENVKIWSEILRLLPPTATGIKVQGFYGSFSKLVLVSMPVSIWDTLPQNPAYSFVGFVTTANIMQELQVLEAARTSAGSNFYSESINVKLPELLHKVKYANFLQALHEQSVARPTFLELLADLPPASAIFSVAMKDLLTASKTGSETIVKFYKRLRHINQREIMWFMIMAAVSIAVLRDIGLEV